MYEHRSTRLTERYNHTVDAVRVNLLADGTVDLADSDDWCDIPDVVEGYVGEFTAPLSGDADTETEG